MHNDQKLKKKKKISNECVDDFVNNNCSFKWLENLIVKMCILDYYIYFNSLLKKVQVKFLLCEFE